jgi:hypothetical protein
MAITYVKGRRIDQEKLKEFLAQVNLDDFKQEDGTWMSPISGEIYASKAAMCGSFGSYLRKPVEKDPKEPTRRGYIRAIRAGIEPTEEQKAAHAEYMRALRAGKKISPGVQKRVAEIAAKETNQERHERRKRVREERRAERALKASEAYAASLEQLLP